LAHEKKRFEPDFPGFFCEMSVKRRLGNKDIEQSTRNSVSTDSLDKLLQPFESNSNPHVIILHQHSQDFCEQDLRSLGFCLALTSRNQAQHSCATEYRQFPKA
jgi:hypothetical protein